VRSLLATVWLIAALFPASALAVRAAIPAAPPAGCESPLLNDAYGYPELRNGRYYLRDLGDAPSLEVQEARLEALHALPGDRHQAPFEVVEGAGWGANRRHYYFTRDLVIEEGVSLARLNVDRKVYRFEGVGLAEVMPLSELLLDQIGTDSLVVYRDLSQVELEAWEKRDTSFLVSFLESGQHPIPSWELGERQAFGSPRVYFSIGQPVIHDVAGSERYAFRIRKDKLVDWARRGQLVAGIAVKNTKEILIEAAVLLSAWGELAPFFSQGVRLPK
jgi:hypothetical protein